MVRVTPTVLIATSISAFDSLQERDREKPKSLSKKKKAEDQTTRKTRQRMPRAKMNRKGTHHGELSKLCSENDRDDLEETKDREKKL